MTHLARLWMYVLLSELISFKVLSKVVICEICKLNLVFTLRLTESASCPDMFEGLSFSL